MNINLYIQSNETLPEDNQFDQNGFTEIILTDNDSTDKKNINSTPIGAAANLASTNYCTGFFGLSKV